MIGSSSPINAIAIPKLDSGKNSIINIHNLLYAGASDHVYKFDNYDVVSFCGNLSNSCISFSRSFKYNKNINKISLIHDGKLINYDMSYFNMYPLEYFNGKFIKIGSEKYLEAKYKFISENEITCLHDIKNDGLQNALVKTYLKDITINNFHIDPKTIYYFIIFLSEVNDGLISEGEYNFDEYYKNDFIFEDVKSLFYYIKGKYLLCDVIDIGSGILELKIEYYRIPYYEYKLNYSPSNCEVFYLYIVNQDGNPYIVSKIPNDPRIMVFYNVSNKKAKVVKHDKYIQCFANYTLSDKGLLVMFINDNNECFKFDPNLLKLVPIDVKNYVHVSFSYKKDIDMSICLEFYNDLLEIFGIIYDDILIPRSIILDYGGGSDVIFTMDEEACIVYSGSILIPIDVNIDYNEEYIVNKVFKYMMIRVLNYLYGY